MLCSLWPSFVVSPRNADWSSHTFSLSSISHCGMKGGGVGEEVEG